MEELYFKNEARDKLIAGINKLNDAVSSTLGPNGKTVIIPSKKDYSKYIVTKDGASVAEQVELKDAVENIGAQLIKEVAIKTADEAGDGTTTSTVLATAFINNLKDFEPKDVIQAFDEIIPKVIEQLKANSRVLKRDDIKYVATISANNDMEIGDNIQKAYNFSSIVKVEESNNDKDEVVLVDGTQLNISYFSKAFITDQDKAECELDEPFVLILDGKLDNLQIFETPIKKIAELNKSLLIITEDVSEQTLRLLENNVLKGSLKCCVIKTPGHGSHRKDLLRDLSDLTQSTIITNFSNKYNTDVLGKLKSAKISKHHSILVKHDEVDIVDLIESLDILRKSKELSQHEIDLVNNRYENLAGKITVIKVGGGSEIETKERYDRYDDAVKAVQCALEEGIIEGAGMALVKGLVHVTNGKLFPDKDIETPFYDALRQPYLTIVNNGATVNYKKSLFEQNIIDPLKVTRTALENAVSISKTILTTDCVVLNRREWN